MSFIPNRPTLLDMNRTTQLFRRVRSSGEGACLSVLDRHMSQEVHFGQARTASDLVSVSGRCIGVGGEEARSEGQLYARLSMTHKTPLAALAAGFRTSSAMHHTTVRFVQTCAASDFVLVRCRHEEGSSGYILPGRRDTSLPLVVPSEMYTAEAASSHIAAEFLILDMFQVANYLRSQRRGRVSRFGKSLQTCPVRCQIFGQT